MKRASGVLLHVSSLWGDYSEGSFGQAAKEWIDFLADCGFSYWQTLPFCLPDDYNSPYCSLSTFSVNPYFIDLPSLEQQGLLTHEELEQAKQKTPYSCEFSRLSKERLELLKKASQRFDDPDALDSFFKS
ncbi:MAG: 4-alpha-glucanotransferase, partial [Clostridia bacterium]|nr:4-alpha-glucanotransferase [Clostridia bacterium]